MISVRITNAKRTSRAGACWVVTVFIWIARLSC